MSITAFATAVNNIKALEDAFRTAYYRNSTALFAKENLELTSLAYSITNRTPSSLDDIANSLVDMSRSAYNFFRSNRFLDLCGRLEFLDGLQDDITVSAILEPFIGTYISPVLSNRNITSSVAQRMLSKSVFNTVVADQNLLTFNGVNTNEVNVYADGHQIVDPLDVLTLANGWRHLEVNFRADPADARIQTTYVTEDSIYLLSKATGAVAGGSTTDFILPNSAKGLYFCGRIEAVYGIPDKSVNHGADGVIWYHNDMIAEDARLPKLVVGNRRYDIGTKNKMTIPLDTGIGVFFNAVGHPVFHCFMIRLKGKFILGRSGIRAAITGADYDITSPEAGDDNASTYVICMRELDPTGDNGIVNNLNRAFKTLIERVIADNRPRRAEPYDWNFATTGHYFCDISSFKRAFFNSGLDRSGLTDQQVKAIIELGKKVITIMVVFMNYYIPA